MLSLMLRYVICFIAVITMLGCGGDSDADIEQTQKKLGIIHQAIKKFKSEEYFGKAPSSLQDLYKYDTTYYNIPQQPNTIENSDTSPSNFVESSESYSLIPSRRVFLKSGLSKDEEDEILAENAFITDFGFLPDYKLFLPQNTIIAWDNPGNFNGGGNVLFEDGKVKFLKSTPEEYERLTTALLTQTDRDFVRDICIRNNTDCSLINLEKSPSN